METFNGYAGRHYQVTLTSLTIHGVSGFWSGSQWVIGVPLDETYSHSVPVTIDPAPVAPSIVRFLVAYRNVRKVSAIHTTSRTAVRLFLEHVLTCGHFRAASEQENTVMVPEVMLAGVPYTLVIWPEHLFDYEFVPIDHLSLVLDLN